MKSFVIFSVQDRYYGIDIECVRRILPSQPLTTLPDEGEHIEGMFQYEDNVIKVLSFRKALGLQGYSDKLKEMFPELEAQHKAWVAALEESVETGVPFSKTTDPHACHLGKWINSFHPDDPEVLVEMKKLDYHHQQLHRSAVDVLDQRQSDPEEAKRLMEESSHRIYKDTLAQLQEVSKISVKLAASLQRCLILIGKDNVTFGVNIDAVEDIVHVEESEVHEADAIQNMGEYMDIASILEHEGNLITIVTNISIDKRSA